MWFVLYTVRSHTHVTVMLLYNGTLYSTKFNWFGFKYNRYNKKHGKCHLPIKMDINKSCLHSQLHMMQYSLRSNIPKSEHCCSVQTHCFIVRMLQ